MSAYVLLADTLNQASDARCVNKMTVLAAFGTQHILSEKVILALDNSIQFSEVENLLRKVLTFAV